jgi:hypothetical protein
MAVGRAIERWRTVRAARRAGRLTGRDAGCVGRRRTLRIASLLELGSARLLAARRRALSRAVILNDHGALRACIEIDVSAGGDPGSRRSWRREQRHERNRGNHAEDSKIPAFHGARLCNRRATPSRLSCLHNGRRDRRAFR